MEHVRRYLEDESASYPLEDGAGGVENRSFLLSTRVDGRSSDTKSIGSLSQHLFESDDNEDERYYGTCNGYTSHPGSKSNLLLCSECDLRSRACSYRPQTPSHYGRFVEERIDRQQLDVKSTATRYHPDRRSSTVSTLLKSPMKIEASSRYFKDEEGDSRERRSKSIPSTSPSGSTLQHDQRHFELRSPGTAYRRAVSKRPEQEEETDEMADEGTRKRAQERFQDSRSPVALPMRSPRNIDQRDWTPHDDGEERLSEDPDYLEESEDSPPCPQCNGSNGSNGLSRCAHCNISSDQDDGDLICFRCQMSAEEETTSVEGSVCPKCESTFAARFGTNGSCQTTSSSSEGAKYPVDAVVKIQVNNRSIDVDSDDTIDSDPSNNRDSGDAGPGSIDRLATIVEVKNDTASENGEENGSRINWICHCRFLVAAQPGN